MARTPYLFVVSCKKFFNTILHWNIYTFQESKGNEAERTHTIQSSAVKTEKDKGTDAEIKLTIVTVGWIRDGDSVPPTRGGGMMGCTFSGRQGYEKIIKIITGVYETDHRAIGLKIGRAADPIITEFPSGIITLGEFCKNNIFLKSKVTIYLISSSSSEDGVKSMHLQWQNATLQHELYVGWGGMLW